MRTNEQGDVILNISANTNSAKSAIKDLANAMGNVFKSFKGQSISTPQLDKLKQQAEESKAKISELQTKIQKMSETKVRSTELEGLVSEIEKAKTKFNELSEKHENALKKNIDTSFLEQQLSKTGTQIDNIRAKIINLINSGKGYVSVAAQQPQEYAKANEQLRKEQSNLAGIQSKIESISSSGAKASSGVGNTFKRMGNSVSNVFSKLRSHAKSSSSSAADSFGNINKSIKKGITTLVKYGLGIRSLYFLWKKFRSAIVDSYKDLATYSDDVNKSVSTAKSAISTLKNSMAAMIQPLVTTFAPLVTSFADKLTAAAQKVGQLFAALTGQDYVYTATQVQEDYADALENTADNASKAADSLESYLSPLDDINRFSSNAAASTSTDTAGTGDAVKFTKGTVANQFKDLAEKIKDYFKDIFEPIKSAWNKHGAPVVREWKRLLNNIKGLISDIAQSFRRVWTNGSGERVVGNILKLFRSILRIINSIAETLRTAWNKDSLGDSVIRSFIDRFNNLLELIRAVADDFAEVWNDGTGERIWTNILTIVRNINNIIGGFWAILKKAWTQNENGKKIWKAILGTVEDITEWLKDMSDITLDWITDLDLSPIVSAFKSLLEAIRKLAKVIGEKLKDAYKNVLLPVAKWTIEKGLPALIEAFATALNIVSSVLKTIPISILTGLASGIAAVFVAIKTYQTVKAAWEYIKGLGVAFKGLWTAITAHPYAAALLAIVAAITALVTAIQTANRTKWNNSDLKKSVDEAGKYFDDLAEAAQNMKSTLEEVGRTNIEVKADVSQVETLKEKLIKVIKDGIIDDEEMPEYETIINLLKEVDGFEEMWNGMELQEIDGKIHINSEEAIKQLEDFVEKWKLTQWQTALSSDYSSLYSAQGTNKRNIASASGELNTIKKALLEKIKKSGVGGDYIAVGDSSKIDKNNWTLDDVDKWFTAYKAGKFNLPLMDDGLKDVVSQYDNAVTSVKDYTENANALSTALTDNWEAQKFLNGETDNYIGALYAVDSGLMSEADALALLKDQGVTSYDQLVAKANEQKEAQIAANGETAQSNATVSDSYSKIGDAATAGADIAKSSMDSMVGHHEGSIRTLEESNKSAEESNNELSNNSIKMSGSVADAFTGAFGRIREKAANLWDRLKELFSGDNGIGKGIANFAIAGINKIIGAVNTAISKICGFINSGLSAVRDFELFGKTPFSWLPTITPPQIPEIPALARGAVLPAGKPFVAMLGDQKNGTNLEAPESLIRKIVREESQANKSQPIVAPVNIDGQHFFDIVIERGRAYIAQTGHNPFTTAVGGN